MKTTFGNFARMVLAPGAIVLTAVWLGAAAQEPSGTNSNQSQNAQEARDTAKGKIDAARETKQGAREEIRDAREGARDTARDDRQTTRNGREEARDTVGDERRTIREARRDVRAARREFIASRIRSGDLGLWFRRVTDGLAVTDIANTGAIAQSGLKEGDEIVSVNSQPVATEREFVDQLFADHESNRPAQVVIRRNGQQQTLAMQTKPFVEEHINSDDRLHDFGLILDQADANHVKVQAVIPRSPAFYAGVRSGDQITGFSGERIARLTDFIKSLANANTNTAQMDVNRNNQQRQLEIEIPDPFQNQTRTALRPTFQDPNATQQPAQQQQPTLQQQPVAPGGARVPANTQPRLINPPRQ